LALLFHHGPEVLQAAHAFHHGLEASGKFFDGLNGGVEFFEFHGWQIDNTALIGSRASAIRLLCVEGSLKRFRLSGIENALELGEKRFVFERPAAAEVPFIEKADDIACGVLGELARDSPYFSASSGFF
jgi:hypothetical protein